MSAGFMSCAARAQSTADLTLDDDVSCATGGVTIEGVQPLSTASLTLDDDVSCTTGGVTIEGVQPLSTASLTLDDGVDRRPRKSGTPPLLLLPVGAAARRLNARAAGRMKLSAAKVKESAAPAPAPSSRNPLADRGSSASHGSRLQRRHRSRLQRSHGSRLQL
ncbi:unnamed protein product [Lampetra planeri]